MKEAAEFAETTQILMNVSEFTDVSQATDTLISAVQAFGYTAETSMDVVDLLNTIGNNYAISTADLAQSLTKSSASLVAAGGNLAEAAALTATANAIIQDADSVGTALKTTSLRLRGTSVKVLEDEGLDSDGAIESTSKLRSQVLATSGVDILTDTGAYKSTYQILLEIAEVWDQITDDKARAGLLELLAGKRNSSVIAALLQNPEDLKAAYKDAMNAEGSALKENEKYLDSIQGKIDQFNNAMQAMWSDTLDSDIVKGFVALGTEIIKIIDKIGLLNSALLAFGAYKGISHIFNSFKNAGVTLKSVLQYVNSLTVGFKANAAAQVAANGATMASNIANKLFRTELVKTLATQYLTTQSTQALEQAKYALKLAEMGLMNGVATAKDVQAAQAAVEAASIPVDITKISTTELMGLAFKQLAISIWAATKAILAFLFTNPVGWAILAVTAVISVVAAWNKWGDTTENLREKLSGLKSEISDIKSEIDSLNGELETTQERMAELLAKDSLTFTEQEELDNLQKQNDLLERQIYLLEQKEKRLQAEAQRTFDKLMKKSLANNERDLDEDGEKDDVFDRSLERRIGQYKNRIEKYEAAQEELVQAERELEEARNSGDEAAIRKAENKVKRKEKKAERKAKRRDKKKGQIDDEIAQYLEDAEGIDYESADSTTRAYLDYIDNTVGKLAILEGDAQAKSMEIKRIFNKDSLSGASDEIDRLVEQLKQNPGDKNIIAQISEQCKLAEGDLKAVGLSVQDAVDYFTMSGSSSSDYIMQQYGAAVQALGDLKAGTINLSDFVVYDSKTGKADADILAIAERLKGVSPEVQKQFAAIVEDIKEGAYKTEDGLINWDAAIKKLELQGMQAVIASVKTELEAANKLAFPDLEISGWIDSVEELKGAFESLSSAMDLIVTAQEQMNSSGRISMKTALDLMTTTDNWNQILEVNNGVITMNANAEQILIQSKLDLIKANIDMALQQVETDIALMEGAINSTKAGNAFTQGFTKALTNAQGVLVGLKAGWDAFWAGEDVASAFNGAYNKTVDNLTPDESSLGDLYKQRDNLKKQREMLNGVDTTQEFKNNYDFDKKPGDKYGDSEDDAFQREMDYWENRIAANQAKYEQLQNEIDLLEAKGQKADTSYYQEQIKLENERKTLLEGQRAAALARLQEIEAAGGEGNEQWWEVANTLNDIEGELDGVTASIQDLNDAMAEVEWYKFDEFHKRIGDLHDDLETIRTLIAPNGEEDWFDDEGNWTEKGVAVLGSYVQDLEFYEGQLEDVQKKLNGTKFELPYEGNEEYYKNLGIESAEEFNQAYYGYSLEYAGNEDYYKTLGIDSEQELYDTRQELIDQQYDYAQSISDTEQSIVDMYESSIDAVEEYTETLIDSYNDYIDSVKEALQAERDLYDFKKNVQKQSKDIAAIERRIASLSGSTNASDIAERRKLEAELYESRESLNDTYYDHARSAQDEALDAEQTAYEETMTKFIEGLRIGLESATANMDEFLMSVTSMVTLNADTVLAKYQETELPLGDAITNPWQAAIDKIGEYDGDALELMNKWTQGGFFDDYKTGVSSDLSSPWTAGSNAADAFETSVGTVMDNVVSKIETNVQSAATKLSDLYQQILDTEKRAAEADVTVDDDNDSGDDEQNYSPTPTSTPTPTAPKRDSNTIRAASPTRREFKRATSKNPTKSGMVQTGLNIGAKSYNKSLEVEGKDGIYYPYKGDATKYGYVKKGEGYTVNGDKLDYHSFKPLYYAKGTTGTPRDEWAITDEFGPELKMYATPEGNLSFMALGSTVVPHDLTMDLIELPSVVDGLINRPKFDSGINMIANAINKPEIVIDMENFLKVDRVDKDTLPQLEAMMDKKIDTFAKQLNYSIKRFSR